MSVQIVTNEEGKETAVLVPIEEWEEMQKRLNTINLYDDFDASLESIKKDISGTVTLKNARTLINEL